MKKDTPMMRLLAARRSSGYPGMFPQRTGAYFYLLAGKEIHSSILSRKISVAQGMLLMTVAMVAVIKEEFP